MRYIKWIIVALVVLTVGGFLHYTLPRNVVVRVVGVETRLETFGANRLFFSSAPPGGAEGAATDVRYIETFRSSGRELVFRNEDTGWGWPPYFKNDSADLQARARDVVSTSAEPQWVAINYYGIRNRLFSIYPNALSIQSASGPDDRPWPVTRIVVLTLLAAGGVYVTVLWRRFRRRRLNPALDAIGERAERASSRFWRFLDRGR